VRTFSCLVLDEGSAAPTRSLILADSVERARVLAARELAKGRSPVSVELREGGKLLWAERSRPAGAPGR
jgi:hypothetical protein